MENEPNKESFKLDTSPESLKSGLSALAVLVIIKLFGGGLIVGALAGGAVYASFYYTGWKRIAGLIIAVCLAILGIYFASSPVMEQSQDGNQLISGEVRSNVVTNATKSCITKQTSLSENKSLSADEISRYCICTANKIGDSFTLNEIQESEMASVIPPIIQQKIDAIGAQCITEVFGESVNN